VQKVEQFLHRGNVIFDQLQQSGVMHG